MRLFIGSIVPVIPYSLSRSDARRKFETNTFRYASFVAELNTFKFEIYWSPRLAPLFP